MEYLKRLPLSDDVQEYIEYYAKQGVQSAASVLKTGNFTRAMRRSGRTAVEIQEDFKAFVDALCDEIPPSVYAPDKLAHMCRDSLAALVRERDTTIQGWLSDPHTARQAEMALNEKLVDFGLKARIIKAVNRSFSREYILSCLSENPYTAKEVARLTDMDGRLALLRSAIADTVPSDIKELYPIARRLRRRFIIHYGPTNSGKTHDALERYKAAETGIYLGPLRLLAFEVFESTNEAGVLCSMRTGEEQIDTPGALHTASTVEMLDTYEHYDVAVIDECQMIADNDRGGSWTRAILGVNADEIHLCCAPNALNILKQIVRYCGDDFEVVEHTRRSELLAEPEDFSFPRDVRDGDALILFSKKSVLLCAAELQKKGIAASVIYGSLPYDVRQNEVRRFLSGETRVVVATDAIGMGLNMPVDRIVFLETEKFDGTESRPLHPEEIQQIAGRAGRLAGKPGFVNASTGKRLITSALYCTLPQIEYVSLGFPRELLQIDGSLSDIFENWSDMEIHEPFRKSDLQNEIYLAAELEQLSSDKDKIFDFVMIPFKESDRDLHRFWTRLFRYYESGKAHGFAHLKPRYEADDLQSMELAYQMNDLLFYYMRLTEQPDEQKLVMKEKQTISSRINSYLAEHPLEGKKCRVCGRPLPWNYRFAVCGRCHAAQERGIYYPPSPAKS